MKDDYSLWLMPQASDRRRWRPLIAELAARHNSPAFEPHITLVSGLPASRATAVEKIGRIAAATSPLRLRLSGPAGCDSYYRCLFMTAVETPPLTALRQRVLRAFDVPASDYQPHLSLMYGNCAAGVKRRLMDELAPRGDAPIVLDKIALFAMRPRVKDWRETAQFELRREI